jgi:hypothetical protein
MKKWLLVILIAGWAPAFAQNKIKSGVIYKEHPYINILNQLAKLYEKGDTAALAKLYADTVQIFGMGRYNVDTSKVAQWSVPPSKRLAGAKTGWQHVFENWENIKMRPIAPSDCFVYNDGTTVVQSWWLFTLTHKKTKKVAKVEMVLFAIFNKKGKISTQIEFYDPTSLINAMK